MSCAPNMTERERRMLRAFSHYAFAIHELTPSTCAGCLEAVAFLTVPGYEGNKEYPTCVVTYEGDPAHYRDETAGLKHGQAESTYNHHEQTGDPQLNCWQVAPGTPDSDGIVWERYELGCSGKSKDGRQCQRYIVGLMGYNGGFEHKVLGHCDLRNKEWLCWQHGAERDREDVAKKETVA